MNLLRQAEYRVQPWQNGGGTTRLVAASPLDAGYSAALDWQISLPSIAKDGPFSVLPGLDRQWLMLEGEGLELDCRMSAASAPLSIKVEHALEPIAFSGAWTTAARLRRGPVTGFSVLSRHAKFAAILRIHELRDTTAIEKPAGETLLLFLATGSVRALGGGASAALEHFDSILMQAPGFEACSFSVANWAQTATIIEVRLAAV